MKTFRKKFSILLLGLIIVLNSLNIAALGSNPPQLPAEPDIVNVALSTNSHTAGNVQAVTIEVDTSNVANNTSIKANLVENDGNTVVSGVNLASALITNDSATLNLSIPANISAGSYKIKVNISSLNLSYTTSTYTVISAGNPNITSVTADVTGHISGIQQTVLVDIETENVNNGTVATVALANNDGSLVSGVTSGTGTINNNIVSDISLVIGSNVPVGSYKIKVTIASISNSSVSYTISSASNDPAITSVSLSSSSQNLGTEASINVNVMTTNLTDGTSINVSLVDSNYNAVSNVNSTSLSDSGNSAQGTLTIPGAIAAGTYYVKALATDITPVYSQAYIIRIPSPTISSISTTGANLYEGQINGEIVINGSNYSTTPSQNDVYIVKAGTNEVVGNKITPHSSGITSSKLTIDIPSNLTNGSYKVKVTCNGVSVISYGTFVINTAPIISSISTSGATLVQGSIDGNITVTGTNFSDTLANNIVQIIDTATNQAIGGLLTPLSKTSNQLIVAIPSGLSAGAFKIRVTVAGQGDTSDNTFSILAPSLTSISTAGAILEVGKISGELVINGSNFASTLSQNVISIVNAGDLSIAADNITPKSGTGSTLSIDMPTNLAAGTYKVGYTRGDFSVISSETFEVTASSTSEETPVSNGYITTPNKEDDSQNPDTDNGESVVTNDDGSTTSVDKENNTATTEYTEEAIKKLISDDKLVISLPELDVKIQEVVLSIDTIKAIVDQKVDLNLVSNGTNLTIPLEIIEANLNEPLKITINSLDQNEIESILKDSNNGTKEIKSPIIDLTIKVGQDETEVNKFSKKIAIKIDITQFKDQIKDFKKLAIYYLDEKNNKWVNIKGKYDENNGYIEAKVDHFTKFAVMEYTKTFKDVDSQNWAKDFIELLAAKGIAEGIDDENFAPRAEVTRAQFATFIVRALDLQLEQYNASFTDVESDKWYTQYIETAYKYGIVNGIGDNKFDPDSNITREQMAALVMKAFAYVTKKDIVEEAKNAQVVFADSDLISPWAKDYVYAANANGIINGITINEFSPKNNALREQVAKIIIKLLEFTEQ